MPWALLEAYQEKKKKPSKLKIMMRKNEREAEKQRSKFATNEANFDARIAMVAGCVVVFWS